MSWKAPVTKSLKELRFHLCQSSPASQGLRDFIVKSYPTLKKANPGLPVLIREAQGVEAKIYARYNHAHEQKASVDNLSSQQVEQKLESLIKQADGAGQARLNP